MENALKIIEAITKQWPFLLILFVITIFILKWNTIWKFIESISQIKVKKGDTEVEFNKENKSETGTSDPKIENQKLESSEVIKESKKDTSDDLSQKYYNLLNEHNFGEAKIVFEKILEKEPNEGKRARSLIKNYYERHKYGDTKAFDEFEEYITKIKGDDEQKANINNVLSRFYVDAGNSQKAINLLLEAIKLTSDMEDKAFYVSRLSTVYYEKEEKQKAIEILYEYLSILNTRKSKVELYRSIALYFEKEGENLLKSIAFQKAIECQPNDTRLLFDAAYNYSQVKGKFEDIGLILYKKLLEIDSKNENALNNIGVSYKNLDMPFKSVNFYKKSVDFGNSLAASNLAYSLMERGFEKEAEEYLINAQKSENVHDNIYTATSDLRRKLSNEKETEVKITLKAERKYRFLNSFGESAFAFKIIALDVFSRWQINDLEAKVESDKNTISITWEQGEEKHQISGIRKRNSLELTYNKPKRNYYSFQSDDKYEYIKHEGYGFIEDEANVKCLFEIDKEVQEFKFFQMKS